MITGADVKNGYGYKKEKPYNSILPYLRAKEAEKGEAKKATHKPVEKEADPFSDAILEIVQGE